MGIENDHEKQTKSCVIISSHKSKFILLVNIVINEIKWKTSYAK